MIDEVLEKIAPHHCYFCDKIGNIVCKSCTYDIVNESQMLCIDCRQPTFAGKCPTCQLPFSKAWVTTSREGEIAKIIDDFKWQRTYQAHKILADLLDMTLPILPETTVIVPIPTISRHIRIRGYDHAKLVAKTFAKQRKLSISTSLKRKNSHIQHTKNRKERIRQAEDAFYCDVSLDPTIPYLILDDIVTTGSTTKAATRVLKRAGAQEVWVAAVARQPLK